jgi:GTP-binding protein EngB required for normal cell division
MLELLHSQGHPTLIVITKADKIGRQERQRRLSSLAGDLQADVDQVQLVSAKSGEGIADLGASLLAALPEGDS